MIGAYNFCGGVSYGYIKKISKRYLDSEKKVFIVNFEVNPLSAGLFPNLKNDDLKKNLILINYANNRNKLKELQINLDDYLLVNKEKNCFFFKKND
jgi:hypothetical protein